MKNLLLTVILIISTLFLLNAQVKTKYSDGPYIFHQNDSLRVQWVEKGVGHDSLIANSELGMFQREGLPIVDLNDLDFEKDTQATFTGVKKIVALSDVHGQYNIMIDLLKVHQIIDEQNHWNFGKGHLVITGDNLDRGDQVLEILWFLFFLEKEAAKAGGKVHVLLGNHEVMVLQGDIRYLNKKYLYTSGALRNRYHLMFREGSILGDWIANHKVMTSINRSLYLHGGISEEILKLDYSLEKMNNTFTQHLVRIENDSILRDSQLAVLYYENGPLWYRGYFKPETMESFPIDKILKKLDQDRIIVGHTSFESIKSLFEGKVLAIDCSIKKGETGQVLLYKKDKFFVGDIKGKLKPIVFNPNSVGSKSSLYDYIFKTKGNPQITINTNVSRLLRKSSKEEYQEASLSIVQPSEGKTIDLNGRIRARGNIRKKVCIVPPIKFDFSKKDLDSLGFMKNDKLKFVFPCTKRNSNQELLYKEFFLYSLYDFIYPYCIKVKLVDVKLMDGEKEKYNFTGFLIEDEEEYARRNNARVIEKGRISASRLDRQSFLKMEFFQYMIANTDWSVGNKHNLEFVKLPNVNKVVALPYDFDYSGFVGHHYAVPHESLPIDNVHQRYFFSYKITEEEFYAMVKYYKSIEEDIYRICDEATYMKPKTIEENKAYLRQFFKLLENPKKLKSRIVKK